MAFKFEHFILLAISYLIFSSHALDEADSSLSPLKGEKGDRGLTGLPGLPGYTGFPGEKGDRGLMGFPGLAGVPGLPGPKGNAGPIGPPGLRGAPGLPGPAGEPALPCNGSSDSLIGLRGPPGLPGLRGIDGFPGVPGLPGESGVPGRDGSRGPAGLPGLPGKALSNYLMSHLLVKHSQNAEAPTCEPGHAKLWEGYSLLYTDGNEGARSQDLGDTGSCIKKFSTMPFLSCDAKGVCQNASLSDRSYWLSTNNPMPMTPAGGNVVEELISRCVVCESPAKVITLHSQSRDIPDCPNGWSGLWSGYSFVMHTGTGVRGGGQSLSSSGSCLEDFRASPFIECNGAQGQCQYNKNEYNFYMATIEDGDQFQEAENKILEADNLRKRISRCQVCIKSASL